LFYRNEASRGAPLISRTAARKWFLAVSSKDCSRRWTQSVAGRHRKGISGGPDPRWHRRTRRPWLIQRILRKRHSV